MKNGYPATIQTCTLVADNSYASFADHGFLVFAAASHLQKRNTRTGYSH